VCNFQIVFFLFIAVGVAERAIIGKILVPDRRESKKFSIDFHIGL